MRRLCLLLALGLVVCAGCSRRGGDAFEEETAPAEQPARGGVEPAAGAQVPGERGGPGGGGPGPGRPEGGKEAPASGEQLGGFVFTETVGGRVARRIRAERMITAEDGTRRLEDLRVEYFPPDGVYCTAKAAEGVYDEASGRLQMRGDARLSVAWGAWLSAPILQWDRDTDKIVAPAGAELHFGSRSFMVADRLEARPSLGWAEMWEASGVIDPSDATGMGRSVGK